MEAIQVLCDGTMRAAKAQVDGGYFPRLARERDTNLDRYCELVAGALRQALKGNLVQYRQEWTDAIEANMPASMLQRILNVQCNHAAAMALGVIEKEL